MFVINVLKWTAYLGKLIYQECQLNVYCIWSTYFNRWNQKQFTIWGNIKTDRYIDGNLSLNRFDSSVTQETPLRSYKQWRLIKANLQLTLPNPLGFLRPPLLTFPFKPRLIESTIDIICSLNSLKYKCIRI